MAQLVVIRPVRFLPGKERDALRWSKETEPIRREFGLLSQFNLRSSVDPNEHTFLQVWESKEAYERWKASAERARLNVEASRMVLNDRTRTFEVL